ncbi:hypothetical protein L0663_19485 [Dyadobacter sp. CY107]|uniref:hypothetical protein n=1 Tax=Dyadobacter fanqingshengii TaxID=2906443 RepID=UPI001F2FD529|nr:hypothetical protein [Dyadobacter fanqingshengii]MCF2505585.1 hypothetical protein [Dyadobacter fanqingshengii]
MKDQILLNLDNPGQLEKLYRTDKPTFKRAFKALYPDLQGNVLASFWNERLNFASEEISWGSSKELTFVVVASLIAGLIAKIPTMFHINEDFFYPRNIGFVVFPALMAFFVWKNEMHKRNIIVLAGATLAGLVYINLLPDVNTSDTLVLACIHLALFLWSLLGFAFVGDRSNVGEKRLGFLKYNGDLVVMTGLILISGGILTAITINLFLLIGIKIDEFYFQNIGVFGLAAAPIVGTYLTQTNPQLVGKVSPVIAKIFSPLVLVMLLVYLVAMIYSGKDPYNDREFLLIFNALLVGVMAIIFFSVAETAKTSRSQAEVWVIFLLSIVTIAVNGIALSAILFRISEWGITPNRAAVLGSNVLILINLLLVTIQIYKVMTRKKDIIEVGKTIGSYLPVYFIWTIIVTFVFPLIFGFK